jgi:hypothetical protein
VKDEGKVKRRVRMEDEEEEEGERQKDQTSWVQLVITRPPIENFSNVVIRRKKV